MDIEFTKKFRDDIKHIKDQALLERISSEISGIQAATNLTEIPNIKKLRGFRNFYRIRLGEYRIGLCFNDGIMIFSRFLHRKDIYKYFP
jgi:mRNA interferase RelE/StbE